MRIPKVLHLPYNYSITVKQISKEYMEDTLGLEDCEGAWLVDDRTIFVRKDLSFINQMDTFLHELDHGINDYRSWVLQKAAVWAGAQKRKAKAQKKSSR